MDRVEAPKMPDVVAGSMDKVDLQGVTNKLGEEAAALVQKCTSGRALTQEDTENLSASIERKVDSTFDVIKEKTKRLLRSSEQTLNKKYWAKYQLCHNFWAILTGCFIGLSRKFVRSYTISVMVFSGVWEKQRNSFKDYGHG